MINFLLQMFVFFQLSEDKILCIIKRKFKTSNQVKPNQKKYEILI
jgi:hypothetical protein